MVTTRPFNEHLLWKGKVQLANYPAPSAKPPMILPKINSLTGKVMDSLVKPGDLEKSYSDMSKKYWAGVEERKRAYRRLFTLFCGETVV